MGKSRKRKKVRAPGLVVTLILLLICLEFMALLAITKLLPVHLLFVAAIVLLTMVLLVALMTGDFRKKIPFVIGVVLSILLLIILLVGNLYVLKTYNTLSRISGVNTKTSQIGVYVREDDPAQTIQDAQSYTFGTMSDLDLENTQEALKQINENLGTVVQTEETAGVIALVDKLMEGDCEAIILNHAYLPVLADMEGYEEIETQLREIELMSVDTVIEQQPDAAEADKQPEPDPDNVIRLYISGIDTRGSQIINTRSDVNIIATINTDTKQMLLVSTPRDYFVPLSISNGMPDKLTHAGIYGVDVSMDTLGMLYDIPVNYYFRGNFAGFVTIIDALGGIEVDSDYSFSSGGYSFSEGINYLSGDEALVFARERHAFAEGDRQRGKNQMAVIEGVMKKAMSPELLSNYSSIMSAIEGCFDTNFSYDKIAELVRDQLSSGGSWNVVSYSVDGTGDTRQPYSMSANAYVMIPDESTVEKAKELMQQVVDGEVISLGE